MTTVVAYRRAGPADVEAMAALRSASGWDGGADATRMARYLAGEHHPQQALAERAAFVAEADGAVVGYVAGHLTRRFACDGELQWIVVAPAWRGRDVASGLLGAQMRWFREAGARRICVNVAPENAPARRFYARHGAAALSSHWMVWDDIGA